MSRPDQTGNENAAAFAAALAASAQERFVLKLFVAGNSSLANRAIVNARRLCETHLAGRYELEIVDVAARPAEPARWEIIALPTLLKVSPLPLRRFIGDLSDTARVLAELGVVERRSDDV